MSLNLLLILFLFLIQLKVHGQPGTTGVLAWVHATLMQKEIGPEVSQMAQFHAQGTPQIQEVAQVLKHSAIYNEK